MSLRVNAVTIDCADPQALAEWWAAVLDWVTFTMDDDDGDIWLTPGTDPAGFPTPQDAEVARLEAMGAARVDIGQGDVSWVVTDPVCGQ